MMRTLLFVGLVLLVTIQSMALGQDGPNQPAKANQGETKEYGVLKIYCEDLQKYVAAMSKAPQWKSEKDAVELYAKAFDYMLRETLVNEMNLSPDAVKKIYVATSRIELLLTAVLPPENNDGRFRRAKSGGVAVLKLNDFSMLKLENPSEKYNDVDIYKTGHIYAAKTGDYLVLGFLPQVKKTIDNLKNGKSACAIDTPGYKKAEEKGKTLPMWAYFDFDNFTQFAPGFERGLFGSISKSLQDVTGTSLFYGLDYNKGNFGGKIETLSVQDAPMKNASFFAPKKFTLAPNLPDKYLFMITGHFQKPEEAWQIIKEKIREAIREQAELRGRGAGQDFFDAQLAMVENELGIKIDADLVPACAGEFGIVLMDVPGKSYPYPLFVIKSVNPVMAKEFLKKIRAIAGQHKQVEEVDAANGAKLVIVDRNDFNYIIDGDLIYISPSDKLLKDAFAAVKAGKTLDKDESIKKKMAETNSFFVSFNLETINKEFSKLDIPACMKENSFLTAFCNVTDKSSVLNSDLDIFSLVLTEIYHQEKRAESWKKHQEVDRLGNQLTTAVEQYSQKHNAPPEKIEQLVKDGLVKAEQLKSPLDKRQVTRSFGLVASKSDGMIYVYGYQPSLYEPGKTFKVYGANYPNTFDGQGIKQMYDMVDPIPAPAETPEKKPATK